MLESKEERHAEELSTQFRRRVLDLLAAGRSVTEVAGDLGISGACIYN